MAEGAMRLMASLGITRTTARDAHRTSATQNGRRGVGLFGFTCLCALSLAPEAQAESCPDFFRFADFGLTDQEGRVVRGGPIFRGQSFEGRTLFDRAQAVCRKVANIASDGHGNPIPVVAKISYDVSRTGLELSTLDVTYAKDTPQAALENARQHRQNLVGTSPMKGPASLCARADQC